MTGRLAIRSLFTSAQNYSPLRAAYYIVRTIRSAPDLPILWSALHVIAGLSARRCFVNLFKHICRML